MNPPQQLDWRQVAARMRGALDRADLTGRSRRVAEFAIKATLMQGRTRVVIPNKAELCRVLKVGQNHVAEVVAALQSAGIVRFTDSADGWELLVYPDSSGWSCDWFYSREEMSAYLDILNRAAGQVQGELIEPPPSLARTMAEVSALNSQSGKQKAESKNWTSKNGKSERGGVPKMGSPLKKLEPFKNQTLKALSFDSLKEAVGSIREKDEAKAVAGIRAVLGETVMLNDGGKWRLRWRSNPEKVWRVMAATAEDAKAGKVRNTGAHSEYTWKQFA